MEWWIVVLVSAEMAFVLGLIWIIAHFRAKQQALRTQERQRLLDRFESAQALADFLDRDGGQRLLELSAAPRRSPVTGLVWALGTGLVLALLGTAFLLLMEMHGDREFVIPGLLLLMMGIAVLVTTLVGFLVAGTRGILGKKGEPGSPPLSETSSDR